MKFSYDKIYTFRYKPISEGTIHCYDKTPLMIPIAIYPKYVLGVNLHWIQPKQDRLEFYESVLKILEKNNTIGKQNQRIRLTYTLLQKPKWRRGLIAIRMYYFEGITAFKEVPESTWNHLMGKYQREYHRARFLYKSNDYKE